MSDDMPVYKLVKMNGVPLTEHDDCRYSAEALADTAFDDRNTAYEKLMSYEIGVQVMDDNGDYWERVS